MRGADAIVFTGGIAKIRLKCGSTFAKGSNGPDYLWTDEKNQKTVGVKGPISRDGSRLAACVIPTDEELLIARDTTRCIQGKPNPQ